MRVVGPLSQPGHRSMFISRQRTGCGRKTHMDVMPRITNKKQQVRDRLWLQCSSIVIVVHYIPSYHGTRLAEMGCAFTRIYA